MSNIELLDKRINEQFEILDSLHTEKKITNGNTATYLILMLEICEPILAELSLDESKKDAFEFNTEAVVRLASLNANQGIKEVVQSGKKDILLLKIQGLQYGDSIINQYKYLFKKLDALKKNEETEVWFKSQNAFFNEAYQKLGAVSNEGGCYIATMAYGDYNHPQVLILRHFRDEVLDKTALGKWFIKTYYHYSPKLVERLKNQRAVNCIIRKALNQFIKLIK